MKRGISAFVMAGVLLAGVPALAADPPRTQAERLERGYEKVARRDMATKGSVHPELIKQKREIQELIRRLEAGENVAPSEVDQVLRGQ